MSKTSTLVATATLALGVLGAAAASATADSGQTRREGDVMAAQERIDRSFALRSGADVSVNGIAGSVSVETREGGEAEVHIVRMARTQRELDCYRTIVEQTGGGLRIAHEQDRSRECRSINSRQEVRLVLPRSVNLQMSSIAGRVEVGELDGRVRLDSVAGNVHIASARSGNLSSLAGGLRLDVGRLDPSGFRISSVVGPVELGFRNGANADVTVDSVMGSVRSESDQVRIHGEDQTYRARVGAGGPAVAISSVVGRVRLRTY